MSKNISEFFFVNKEFDLVTERDFFKNRVFILKWRSSQVLTWFG